LISEGKIMKVFVYYNLHKHTWSIKALEGANKGKVIGHRDFVVLVDATPKVSEAGRQRVLKEKRKNVHAGVVGYWQEDQTASMYLNNLSLDPSDITYNPYKYDSFVYTNNTGKWIGSPLVLMNAKASNKVIVMDEV